MGKNITKTSKFRQTRSRKDNGLIAGPVECAKDGTTTKRVKFDECTLVNKKAHKVVEHSTACVESNSIAVTNEMQTRSKRKRNEDYKIKNMQSVETKSTTEPKASENKYATHVEVQYTRQTRASQIRKRSEDKHIANVANAKSIAIETPNESNFGTQIESNRKRRRNEINQDINNPTKSSTNSKATAKKGRKSTKIQLQERMSDTSPKNEYMMNEIVICTISGYAPWPA